MKNSWPRICVRCERRVVGGIKAVNAWLATHEVTMVVLCINTEVQIQALCVCVMVLACVLCTDAGCANEPINHQCCQTASHEPTLRLCH